MPRKVFISVLGAGIYEKCKYTSGDFVSSETTFIQHATLQYLRANEWSSESKALFLLTEKARTDNWEVPTGKRFHRQKNKDIPYKGLHEILQTMNLPFSIEPISIPDGKDENEMWQIFEDTFKKIEVGDELYFDLTHSFRYLPMLMLVLGNYTKFLKHTTVCSITYGNYEARNYETNEAPIVNLLPLSSLQDWTFATADFMKNGYADRLVELSQKGLAPLLRNEETRGDENVKKLRELIKHLESFTTEMRLCRGMDVIECKSAENIRADILGLHTIIIPQLEPVLQEINKSVESFSASENVLNMFKAAQWCFKNQLYQQSTTFLEEGIISYFCLKYGIRLDQREKRELITSAFNIIAGNIPEEKWKVGNPSWLDQLREIVKDIQKNHNDFVGTFSSIVAIRNDYNHCGMREGRATPASIKNKIKSRIDSVIPKLYPIHCEDFVEEKKDKLFINLSNHPSENWSDTQKETAQEYGEIIDIPFPSISPAASHEEIEALVSQYIEKILSLGENHSITVHVMGEMTFTYMMVSQLKEMGIPCLASTTDRIVEETTDGKKISNFRFVRFRKY